MSDRLLKESDVLKIAFQLPLVVNSTFADAVKALPSADRPQEWIPCNERLPEKNDYYLIQITNRDGSGLHMMVAWYQNNHFFTDGIAVAWMQLPQPWKGADDE